MQTPSPVRSGSSVASAAAPRSVGCSCCRGTHPLSAPSCRTDDRHSGAVGSPPSSGCCLHNTCIACSAAVAVAAAAAAAHSAGCRRQELSGFVVHLLQHSTNLGCLLDCSTSSCSAPSASWPSACRCSGCCCRMLGRPAAGVAVVPSTRGGSAAIFVLGFVLAVLSCANLDWRHEQQHKPPCCESVARPWGYEKTKMLLSTTGCRLRTV